MTTKIPKIAVFHDAFLYRGGGERLVTLLAKSLNADLISGFFSQWSFLPEELGFSGKKIALGKPIFAKWFRHFTLKKRFESRQTQKILENYDIIIFSGNCLDALKNVPKNAKILYYCHTPPRYLFDFRQKYLQKLPFFLRPIIELFFDYQAKNYQNQLSKIHTIFTNSQNTHDRLLHFCKKNSHIVYPPTDTSKFIPKNPNNENNFIHILKKNIFESTGKGEYFLSFSRLSPPKRVEIVVDAFLKTPDKNLVFTFGKNDPEREKILAKIIDAKNIFAIPAPSDADFIALVQNAMANIYIPIDEDFGMSPVEAMACGVPTIGVNEWGLKETIIDGKTGILIDIKNHNDGVEKIAKIIAETPTENWQKMAVDCRNRALDFSLERFVENIKNHIKL